MIRRILGLLFMAWALGFLWFAIALPQPVPAGETDVVVVPTGSGGRIERGLELLRAGSAERMLVSGVDTNVRPREFAAEYEVEPELMRCCVALGFAALDTRGNARETADWIEKGGYGSLRLVTSDWHMRRASAELDKALPDDVMVIEDAVRTQPSLGTLFLEYHKLIATLVDLF